MYSVFQSTDLDNKEKKRRKGVRGGNCNVTACQRSGASCFNTEMKAYYCKACAEEINRFSGDVRKGGICDIEDDHSINYEEKFANPDDDYTDSKSPLSSKHIPSRRRNKKAGRNDPCPCGSQLKHKKCCM